MLSVVSAMGQYVQRQKPEQCLLCAVNNAMGYELVTEDDFEAARQELLQTHRKNKHSTAGLHRKRKGRPGRWSGSVALHALFQRGVKASKVRGENRVKRLQRMGRAKEKVLLLVRSARGDGNHALAMNNGKLIDSADGTAEGVTRTTWKRHVRTVLSAYVLK